MTSCAGKKGSKVETLTPGNYFSFNILLVHILAELRRGKNTNTAEVAWC